MKQLLGKISNRAGSPFLIFALWAATSVVQYYQKASPRDILLGIMLAFIVYVIWVGTELLLNRRFYRRVYNVFPWLYSLSISGPVKPLFNVEGKALTESNIYLVTPNLHNDAHDPETISVVKQNLDRGIKYFYLTRKDDFGFDNELNNIDLVYSTYSNYWEQVRIYVTQDLFEGLPTFNVLIIERDARNNRRVFIELPVYEHDNVNEQYKTRSPRNFWVEAEARFADIWYRKVLDALKNRKAEENTYTKLADSSRPLVRLPE